jgi:hypothetical protein
MGVLLDVVEAASPPVTLTFVAQAQDLRGSPDDEEEDGEADRGTNKVEGGDRPGLSSY